MSLYVSFHEEAQAEFDEAVAFYAMERFPYSVMYSVVGNVIRVLAVAHDRRRPFYWSRRS